MGADTLNTEMTQEQKEKLFKEVQNQITVDREPDPAIFNLMIAEVNYAGYKTTQDAMILFYNSLHKHVIHPLQEENKMNWKETGRLILEAFDADRERMLLEQKVLNEENTSAEIRSFIQKASEARIRKTPKKI